MKLTLGCDPELFLADAAGAVHSCIGLIGGTKAVPAQLPLGDGYAVQEDNVAVEFNIPPAGSREEWDSSIQKTIEFLQAFTKEQYGLSFSNLSAALFPEDQLDNPAAQAFGCEPDYDAWTGKMNPKPEAADKRLRSCGGHIHIGLGKVDAATAERMGRLMDLYAGVPSVLMDNGELRKELYGKRGAMRYKPYGMEYRTLSNFWVLSPETRNWAWDATHQAVEALQQGMDVMSLDQQIAEAINNNNKAVAMSLVKDYSLKVI
jgi:hypothetical protein